MPLLEGMGDVDLTSVSTKYPVIKSGTYPWLIKESVVEPIKNKPDHKKLVLKLELQVDAVDNSPAANPIAPGYVLTHNITLTPTEKRTQAMIARDVCSVIDAAFGEEYRKSLGSLANFDSDTLVSQAVNAKTSVEAETQEFPEQARIARFIAKES